MTLNGKAQLPELAEQAQTLNLKVATLVADTRAKQYRADDIQLGASLYHSAMQETPLSLDLQGDAAADFQAQTATLGDLVLSGDDGLDLKGSVNVTQLNDAPRYQGRMELAPLSVRDWLTRFGIEVNSADDEALTALSLSGPFSGDAQRIDFDDLQMLSLIHI